MLKCHFLFKVQNAKGTLERALLELLKDWPQPVLQLLQFQIGLPVGQ